MCAVRGIELLSVELLLIQFASPGVRDMFLMIFHACALLPLCFILLFSFLQVLPRAC